MKSKFFGVTKLALTLFILGILSSNAEAYAKATNLHELTALNHPTVNCVSNPGTDCRDPATGNIKSDQKNADPVSEVGTDERSSH